MGNEVILYVQIASIVAYVASIFGLYRLLVSQKDARIDLLNERIKSQSDKITELESQTPDELAKALSDRVDVYSKELVRLRTDNSSNKDEIQRRESELLSIKQKLDSLSSLIQEF